MCVQSVRPVYAVSGFSLILFHVSVVISLLECQTPHRTGSPAHPQEPPGSGQGFKATVAALLTVSNDKVST